MAEDKDEDADEYDMIVRLEAPPRAVWEHVAPLSFWWAGAKLLSRTRAGARPSTKSSLVPAAAGDELTLRFGEDGEIALMWTLNVVAANASRRRVEFDVTTRSEHDPERTMEEGSGPVVRVTKCALSIVELDGEAGGCSVHWQTYEGNGLRAERRRLLLILARLFVVVPLPRALAEVAGAAQLAYPRFELAYIRSGAAKEVVL